MEDNRKIFGYMPDGTPVEEITLRGENVLGDELVCKVITYGAAIRALIVPDWQKNPVDIVLGFDTLEDYMAQDKYIGAVVGRYANRIGGAKFTLNGEEYKLAANDGPNSLHGGNVGFDKQVWTVKNLGRHYVSLTLVSPDGQEGYPGTLEVEVSYMFDHFGKLCIEYTAKNRSGKATVWNLTNHSYFNLSGHDSGSVEDQHIQIYADYYTPTGPGSIPTGEIASVEGTPMDLRRAPYSLRGRGIGFPIGAHIDDDFEQLTMAGGYDHNWVLRPRAEGVAEAWSPKTGILLGVFSSMPGVQFYTGNYLDGCPKGKGGAVYGKRHGFCLETQHFPDTPNKPEFRPSGPHYREVEVAHCQEVADCVLEAGESRSRYTKFSFGCLRPSEVSLKTDPTAVR